MPQWDPAKLNVLVDYFYLAFVFALLSVFNLRGYLKVESCRLGLTWHLGLRGTEGKVINLSSTSTDK